MFRFLKNYFSFTRGEQNGLVVLVVLIVLLVIAPYLIPLFVKKPQADFAAFKNDIAAFERNATDAIEINSADSADFDALEGIGPVISKRILKFRSVLGGFASVEQMREVYGLDSAWYQKTHPLLTVDTALVQKIAINTISEDSLKIHPYFRKNIAQEIVAYREKNGAFTSIEELKKVSAVNEEVYRKIRPYVSL